MYKQGVTNQLEEYTSSCHCQRIMRVHTFYIIVWFSLLTLSLDINVSDNFMLKIFEDITTCEDLS